tara:strand:- start:23998 stop:24978 length:981 start_codon:yes stop_codon:yes gene_type:complete
MEVMIPSLKVKSTLLGNIKTSDLIIKTKITPKHSGLEERIDGYWSPYILKSKEETNVLIEISITPKINIDIQSQIEAVWVDIFWRNYGPFGQIKRREGFAIGIKKPTSSINFHSNKANVELIPIKTHILGSFDDPIDVIKNYSSSILKKGDILTIGESPLAVMQGRYLFPSSIKVSLLSRLLCKNFHPTSSLATACGMQSLINIEGPSRIFIAWLIGGSLKLFGFKGFFYRIAGAQARLIDDITGTTPPYDKTIVLGPINHQSFCNKASKELGIDVAIVDVNDLGRVKILSSSLGSNLSLINNALVSNPAGNANQHTPLVLIRPCE